ncbi:response regulator [Halobacteria archaeon AArc-dxtr1]|nr:response regulator [Halobacteria archaeon AArc-dxtr1]
MTQYTPDEPVDILLVEDNPGDVRLTQEAFSVTDSVIEFHVVTDGKGATDYFQQRQEADGDPHPDLVLLDLNLPRTDGFEVLDVLNRELDYPPPPILILSSSETEEDILRSYDNAANAYLTKPNDMAEFNSMAQAIENFWIDTVRHPPTPS